MTPVKAPPLHDPASLIMAKVHMWANGFFLMLPNLIAGAVFLIVAWLIGKGVAIAVRRLAHHRGRPDLGELLASISFGAIVLFAIMTSAAIVFPSVKPSGVLSALGIGSVAVGFAFKDILQNLFAGLLILLNRPFRQGDQIVVKDFEGTVEHIESRATLIRTYDGKRVIIPNADIYTSPVTVNTAFPSRRDYAEVGVGYGDDPLEAGKLFAEVAKGIEGVEAEPAPESVIWSLDSSQVTLRVRWWVKSVRSELVHTRARVLAAIHKAAAEHGIDLPYDTKTILFHDQTDAHDGDRARQREGWPAGKDPPPPRPDKPGPIPPPRTEP